MAVFFAVAHMAAVVGIAVMCYRIGKREGQRLEVKTMIELLDSVKVDSWEHRVFRDRFKAALQWVLDVDEGKKRRKERHGTPD